MHLAALKGHSLIAEALLSSGAVADAADKLGMTAATLARRRGHVELQQRLLDTGDVWC